MKRIKDYIKEVKEYYYLDESGKVFDLSTNDYLVATRDNRYSLCVEKGKKKFSIKVLYRACYDEEFIYNDLPCEEGEEWRVIENTNKCYYVSNKGRVFSKNRKYNGEIMIPNKTKDGYLRLQIVVNGKRKDKFVHDLVAESFMEKQYPLPLKGYHVHHLDMNKDNCELSNLLYLTPSKHRQLHCDVGENVDNKASEER